MSKVFGIGLSRTGTLSLTHALAVLGLRATHFPMDRATRAEIANYLRANDSSTSLRLTALARWDAITDTPAACTYDALDRAYPGSRFVLTVRDRESWLLSCERYWHDVLLPLLERRPPEVRDYINLINRAIYETEVFDSGLFNAAYDRHLISVTDHFHGRSRDFIVLDLGAGEGWAELCSFLQRPPPQRPFPHLNHAAT